MCKRLYLKSFYMQLQTWKYLAIIIDDAVFTCDEVIGSCDEETKTILTHFNEKKAIFKT